MTRTRSLVLASVLFATSILVGCSMFTKPDSTTTTAPSPGKIEAGSQGVANTVALFGPWGQALGALILLAGATIAAHYRGKEIGWTEATGTPSTPGTPPQAILPPKP